MPPHCDSMDGPVVGAAQRAIDAHNVDLVLPFVHKDGEAEIRRAFELTVKARSQGPEAKIVAERYFYETTVRVHRAGEGAPFTSLKPAGLDLGAVIPLAEQAIEEESASRLADFLGDALRTEVTQRFDAMLRAKTDAHKGVDAARRHVEDMGLEVWAHKLFGAIVDRGEHR